MVIADAARSVRRSPTHSLFVIFILAVGIASAVVTFSVVDAVVLRPIALDHSERLVYVSRGFAGYLFQVTPADAPVYPSVAALLAMVGISAALIPARRAARLDPIHTVRAS
jgi:ABC-type antimicrobial peptide transport system permease subunit